MQRFRKVGALRARVGAVAALAAVLFFAGCASVTPSGQSASGSPQQVAGAVPRISAPPVPPEAKQKAQPSSRTAHPAAESPAASRDPNSSLWDRIRAGFAMDELNTPLVAEKEKFYLSRPEHLQRMFQRGGRYLFYIVEELERRGMPTELALLPFVESAMNPVAVSPAQAAGLWQFVPATGKQYNLHQNWWVDNRRDPVKSTQAALDYLERIYAMHGDDWFLALASYNWGENAVARAVKKNQARGLPTDYLSLDMPPETRHYVPKLIALKNILLRADELGIALPELPNRPYFVTIEKTRPIDLKLAAQFAGMSVDEFIALNPAHNRPVIAASKNNQIKLPADRKQAFLEAVARHEQQKKVFASWQPYTLKPGESIDAVAKTAGVSPTEIRKANSLKETQRIVAGTQILAPHESVEDEMRVENFVAPRIYEQIERPAVYHTVGTTESLGTISNRYGISATTLAAWNGIKQGIKRGMRLLVQPAATQTLLTNEEGNRTVVATAPKPGFIKVAAGKVDEDAGRGDTGPESTPTTASREPDRPQASARPATQSRGNTRPTAATVAEARHKGEKAVPAANRIATRVEPRIRASATVVRTTAHDNRKSATRADRQRGA